MVDHASLQRRAEADGRRCTVGALIRDGAGRVFVHRRGWGRRLFPGCWDIVGGHVEPGETLVEALRREVEEETGWAVVGDPLLVHVADWERRMEPPAAPRREFDFAVEVEGDLRRPRVEVPKHVDFRWLADNELELLDENRGLDDGLVRRLVALALRPGHPSRPSYPHAMLFLDRTVVAAVEELRAVWDPAMT